MPRKGWQRSKKGQKVEYTVQEQDPGMRLIQAIQAGRVYESIKIIHDEGHLFDLNMSIDDITFLFSASQYGLHQVSRLY